MYQAVERRKNLGYEADNYSSNICNSLLLLFFVR